MPQTADKHSRKRIEVALAKAGVSSWEAGEVAAYLNHDRWVADCPCNGAELVTPGETMLCGSCGAEHKVKFPRSRKKIEELVGKRPAPYRNWKFETTDELVAENIDHGLEDL